MLKEIDSDKERQYAKVMKHVMERVQINERLKWHTKIIKQMNSKIDGLKQSVDVMIPVVAAIDQRLIQVESTGLKEIVVPPQPIIKNYNNQLLSTIAVVPAIPKATSVWDCIVQYQVIKQWPHKDQYHQQNRAKFIQRRYIGSLYERYIRLYPQIICDGPLFLACSLKKLVMDKNGEIKGKLMFLLKYGSLSVYKARVACKNDLGVFWQ